MCFLLGILGQGRSVPQFFWPRTHTNLSYIISALDNYIVVEIGEVGDTDESMDFNEMAGETTACSHFVFSYADKSPDLFLQAPGGDAPFS